MKALLNSGPTQINLIDLSVKEQFYLASFLKSAPFLKSNDSNGVKLSPTKYSDNYIFKYLLDKSIISVFTENNVNIDSLDLFRHVKNDQITIDINVFSTDLADNQLLSNLQDPVISKCNQLELEELTKEVLVLECIEFIIVKLKYIDIPFNYSYEIFEQIKDILQYFSASQFCYVYWEQLKSLNYERSAGKINSNQLIENNISTTISFLKKAKKENWRVSGYYRDKNYTPSVFSNLILIYQYTWGLKNFYKRPNSSSNLQLHVELNPDCSLDPNKQFIRSNGDITNSLIL
ncbi:hypothetical protein DF185_09180 [Marinifilum breve]|uniref:Uncharacterized protein n=1 Tax=Marinifilum breve TaxID=2184082 RepID=A0A2V3ZYR4_9BACT|nr:hypothetical protein [Marinifilum breve]PXY01632.1 hypothetical protein DF185_09180 [Marinifilum breve]